MHPRRYAVPKEVGKVGTNDPSFVQPVAERKDGIAAMFKKQQEKEKLKSPESSQMKTESQDSNLPSEPSSSTSSSKAKGVSESEKMTLGDARKAQKRALEESEEDVKEVMNVDESHLEEEKVRSSPRKKKVKSEDEQASPNVRLFGLLALLQDPYCDDVEKETDAFTEKESAATSEGEDHGLLQEMTFYLFHVRVRCSCIDFSSISSWGLRSKCEPVWNDSSASALISFRRQASLQHGDPGAGDFMLSHVSGEVP